MNNIKSIYTDLDGTLLTEKNRHYQCYADICKQQNIKPLAKDLYWTFKQNKTPIDDVLKKTSEKLNLKNFQSQWISRIESLEYLKLQKVKFHTIKKLTYWDQMGINIILITQRQNKINLIHQLNQKKLISVFFEIIVCTTSGKDAKYLELRKRDINNSILVGDTEIDLETAKRLNIPFVGVTTGLRHKKFLITPHLVKNISEINLGEIKN